MLVHLRWEHIQLEKQLSLVLRDLIAISLMKKSISLLKPFKMEE
jgi:hypothetical protein